MGRHLPVIGLMLAILAAGDAGVALTLATLPLLFPSTLARALRAPLVPLMIGWALLSYAAAPEIDSRSTLDLAQFLVGVLAGLVLNQWYLTRTRWPSRNLRIGAALTVMVIAIPICNLALADVGFWRFVFVISASYAILAINQAWPRLVVLGVASAGAVTFDAKVVLLAVLAAATLRFVMDREGKFNRIRVVRALLVLPLIAGMGLALLAIFNPPRFADIVSPQSSISSMARLGLLLAGIQAIAERPLTGLGPSGLNRPEVFSDFYSDESIEEFIEAGLTRPHGHDQDGFSSGTHNSYLDIASSYGLPMLAIVLLLLWRGGHLAARHKLDFKLAVLVSIAVLGFGWHFSVAAYGMMAFAFAGHPGRPVQKELRSSTR